MNKRVFDIQAHTLEEIEEIVLKLRREFYIIRSKEKNGRSK